MSIEHSNTANVQVEPDGVLIVCKHQCATSHDIVNDIRHIYHTKKVGHTGTLDPMAEGVLVVLLGRAAKAAEYLVSDRKTYLATLRLGLTTDTEDITGTVLSTSDALPTADEVANVCKTHFLGKIMQIPPMYSALKVNGKKLCDLARQGVTVERSPREIEIFALECESVAGTNTDYHLKVTCSSGTYIRTLCADIGAVEHSIDIATLRTESEEERLSHLLPTESLFATLPLLSFSPFYERLIENGCAIAQKKLRTAYALGARLRLVHEDGTFFGLGEVIETDEGTAVKCIKFFRLS